MYRADLPSDPGRPWIVAVAIVVGLVVALLKPWGTSPEREVPPGPAAVPATTVPSAAITDRATQPPGEPAWQCSYANGWRVFAASQLPSSPRPSASPGAAGESPPEGPSPGLRDRVLQPVRTWLAIEPATGADGPLDPGIPVIRVILEDLAALGYCAPTDGPGSPPRRATTSAWSIEPDGARPIGLHAIVIQGAAPGSTEGLFVPDGPGVDAAVDWPAGRYVFRVAGVSTDYERWFGVDVQRWVGGAGEPSSSPPGASIIP